MFEKVNPGHPDKVADRIAGALVDLAYTKEENPRIAVEVLIGHGRCHIIAESSVGMTYDEVLPIVYRIAGGYVDVDLEVVPQDPHLAYNQKDGIRCGDNGIFAGYPRNAEERKLSRIARDIFFRHPSDGKYIIDGDRLIICQSHAKTSDLKEMFPHAEVNPLGDWTGGLDVDSGATNRKLGSDMAQSVTGGGLCVSGDTEYLGDDLRWHRIDEYRGGKVAQWNDGKAEFVEPNQYIHNVNSDFISFRNDSKLDMMLTPDHQVLVQTSKGNYIKHAADEVAKSILSGRGNLGRIPHAFTLDTSDAESRYSREAALRLQVAFCADGSFVPEKTWGGRIRVKRGYKKERLEQLLKGFEYKRTEDGEYSIFWWTPEVRSKRLYECFAGEDLSIVYDEMFKWDGDERRKIYRTTNAEDADFAQLIIASQGKVATINVSNRIGEVQLLNGREYTRKSVEYIVSEYRSQSTGLRIDPKRNWTIDVDYLDEPQDSYCFNVDSHDLILRHNGKVFITGNCGKDLSKADVSVNIYAFLKAQETGEPVHLCCAIGDTEIDGHPYSDIVEKAREFIKHLGGFEKFAEWGLI